MPRILLVALAAATFAAAPSAALAAGATITVSAVGHGSVTFAPAAEEVAGDDACTPDGGLVEGTRTDLRAGTCTLTYSPGQTVTLHAEGGPAVPAGSTDEGPATTFRGWSDDRCAPAPADCAIALEPGSQAVAALFSPQRVAWWIGGGGSVTSSDSPSFPTTYDCSTGGPTACAAKDYELGAPVTLTAAPGSGVAFEWLNVVPNQGRQQTLCDVPPVLSCQLAAIRPRWAIALFDNAAFDESVPPEVSVNFRIRKAGGGSGTVRSGSIDCGTRCAIERKFGDPETLEALPDSGSRFDHWGAACGAAPRCSLAVGPVTSVTAVFERAGSGGGSQQQQQQSTRPRLSARVLRLKVTGHGRKRIIFVRLRVNAASTVRAVLLRGRKRVASKSFRVKAGTPLVRFRVPARVRKGTYRLRLTIKGNGQTRQLTRRVRLPR
jgi:Divergent InlB B-repeat domain